MFKFLTFILVVVTLSISCKSDPVNTGQLVNSGNIIHEAPATISPEQKAQIDNLRSHAHELIKKRSQEEDAYSMMVVGWWVYEAIFAGGSAPKPVEPGYWIKFEDDFSYNYGQYENVQGGGKYHFTMNEEEPKIIMVDDNPAKAPEEWKTMNKEDVMILVGSNYFGNNPKQMKVVKEMSQPARAT